MMRINNCKIGLNNSEVANITNTGFVFDELSWFRAFENNKISNVAEEQENCYPIHFKSINTISNLGKNNIINTTKGIFVETSNLANSVSMIGQTCPFIFPNDIVCNTPEVTFFISEGTRIKMHPQKGIYVGRDFRSVFKIEGTPSRPVVIESIDNTAGS